MKPLGQSDPTSIGPYRLTDVLGGGGMGKVYLGTSATGRRLAIKVLRSELVDDLEYRERFAREIAAARLVSPLFTAAVVDAAPDAESPWLATRFIDGPSLSAWVREVGPLPPRTVMTLAAGLAEALSSIHHVGLVHRDLKPSNVLIDDEGPHIIDFGIALLPDATRLTASLMMGTPSYTSPERIQGGDATSASDIFALGATLVFAATGKNLISQGTAYQQVLQITAGQYDLSRLPSELRPLIARCLSQRALDRPSADEILRVLLEAGIKPPGKGWRDVPVEPPPSLGRDRHASRRAVLIGGSAAVVAAAAGTFAWAGDLLSGSKGVQAAELPSTAPSSASPSVQPSPTARPLTLWQLEVSSPAAGATTGFAAGSSAYVIPKSGVVISAEADTVTATDRTGKPLWTKRLPNGGAVAVRQWHGGVLANDSSTVWLLDPASGGTVFTAKVARDERVGHPDARADQVVVQIYSLVPGVDHVFIDLGTAMIALNVKGDVYWRRARAVLYGQYMPAAQPLGADSAYLAARERTLLSVQLSLFRIGTRQRRWTVPDHFVSQGSDNGGPGGGPPPPPPPNGASPPPGGGPPPGGDPGNDEAWSQVQARIAGKVLATRDNRIVQVFRMDGRGQLWKMTSAAPVADIFVWGDALLVCADELTAWNLGNGKPLWRLPLRGARLAVAPNNQLYAVTDTQVARVESDKIAWQVPVPPDFARRVPVFVTVDGKTVFTTFAAPNSGRATVAAFAITG